MLTKNGKLALHFSGTYSATFKLRNGDTANMSFEPRMTPGYLRILLGSGTTAPTVDDYDLDNYISTLSVISNSYNNIQPSYNDNIIASAGTVVKNNTNEDITITEVGLCNTRNTSDPDLYVLYAREVLDTAVVLHPGDSYSFAIQLG